MTDKKTHWLSKRLLEIGKSKRELAALLDVSPARLTDLENGGWKFQASHIKKVAKYLDFDKTAFLDFVSGDITEEQLWNAKPPLEISEADLQLLRAVKTIATRPADAEEVKNTSLQTESKARNGRER